MAEERIWVRKIKPECKFRAMHETTAGGHSWIDFLCCNPSIINTNRKCDDKRLEDCKWRELIGLSRQEAIKRMAKAIAADDTLVEGYYEMAEKGLNALLEVEK